MPRGDRTGPWGMGPMTGRRAGYCAGYPVPGYLNPIPGRFWGRPFGGGYGWRHWFYATGLPGWARAGWAPAWATPWGVPPVSKEQEIEALQQQAECLRKALYEINRRLEELSKEGR